jgi:hypothetical protein
VNPFYLSGPQFLLFYIVFAGVVIAGVVFWRRRAELSASTPRIDLSDPYLIAYLRGGEKEVERVARFASSSNHSRKPCESYDTTLRRARLLPDQHMIRGRLMRWFLAGLALIGVGFAKVLIAFEAGRTNVGFLIILMILAVVVAAAISFPRLTESGKAMLEDVQSLYGGLRNRSTLTKPRDSGVEPTMLAAVFGVGALSATGYADQLFSGRRKKSEGSCATDSDCGSSGSSSSSSCSSGSSCGSGCGGGCGGCGGS